MTFSNNLWIYDRTEISLSPKYTLYYKISTEYLYASIKKIKKKTNCNFH